MPTYDIWDTEAVQKEDERDYEKVLMAIHKHWMDIRYISLVHYGRKKVPFARKGVDPSEADDIRAECDDIWQSMQGYTNENGKSTKILVLLLDEEECKICNEIAVRMSPDIATQNNMPTTVDGSVVEIMNRMSEQNGLMFDRQMQALDKAFIATERAVELIKSLSEDRSVEVRIKELEYQDRKDRRADELEALVIKRNEHWGDKLIEQLEPLGNMLLQYMASKNDGADVDPNKSPSDLLREVLEDMDSSAKDGMRDTIGDRAFDFFEKAAASSSTDQLKLLMQNAMAEAYAKTQKSPLQIIQMCTPYIGAQNIPKLAIVLKAIS